MMQTQPTRPPYLFFSPKCPHCQQLIEMIKRNQSLAKRIEPINIHTAKNLPPQLDGVPAILFGGQLLVGPDTFKWVQFQTPQQQDRRDESQLAGGMPSMQGGMGGMGSIQGGMNGMQGGEGGFPMPSDISSDVKHGIDFTALPGQEFAKNDPTIPRFSYLPGEGSQSNGTDGIDYVAAMDVNTMRTNKAEGVAHQLERLQQMRGIDSDNMKQQADMNMSYLNGRQGDMGGMQGGMGGMQGGPGFSGPMGTPMGGMNSQMQMQGNQGYQGYNQGMGQSALIQPNMGQQGHQGNPYELQTGARGGYSTQYQQQNNPYNGGDGLPKRW